MLLHRAPRLPWSRTVNQYDASQSGSVRLSAARLFTLPPCEWSEKPGWGRSTRATNVPVNNWAAACAHGWPSAAQLHACLPRGSATVSRMASAALMAPFALG